MSRNSDKLNIIDQNTFQNIKNDSSDNLPRILRSSKYKNKHKKQQPCTLLDFVVVPCKKPKQIKRQKAPHLIAARCTVSFKFKHKGKVRLHAKRRVTRLKRIISKHRKWKQSAAERGSVLENEIQDEPIEQEGTCSDFQLCIGGTEDNIQPDMLQLTTDLGQMSFNKEESRQPMHAIHSRRFRSYCDNCTTAMLKQLSTQLLSDLHRFQKRAYSNNEIKARAHPRLVVGFREAMSRLRINKVKLLLIAPDCELCPEKGGLDETIEELKLVCQQQNVPYCFSLMRRQLAYALQKQAQISCVSILDYDGAQDTYKQLLEELNTARAQYKRLTAV